MISTKQERVTQNTKDIRTKNVPNYSLIQLNQDLSYVNPRNKKPYSSKKELEKNEILVLPQEKAKNLIKHDLASLLVTKLSYEQFLVLEEIYSRQKQDKPILGVLFNKYITLFNK